MALVPMSVANAGEKAGLCALHLQVGRAVLVAPMEHARYTSRQLSAVAIDDDRIRAVAEELAHANYKMPATWDQAPYPDSLFTFNQMFAYSLVFNSIRFMFVDPDTGDLFSHDGLRGAAGLAQILTANWPKISSPGYLASLTEGSARELFRSEASIPHLGLRVEALREVGKFLDEHPNENWQVWAKQFPRAIDLALFVARRVHGFNDPFAARAQQFVGLLVTRYHHGSKLPDNLRNLNGMTVYADSVLPRVLARMGILRYAPALARKIAAHQPLRSGSLFENEIRAATLIATERLQGKLKEISNSAPARDIFALDATLRWQGEEFDNLASRMPASFFAGPERSAHLTVTTDY